MASTAMVAGMVYGASLLFLTLIVLTETGALARIMGFLILYGNCLR